MPLSLDEAFAILRRTPAVLRATLAGLPPALLDANEGEGSWSPAQVMQHLVWAEVDDWLPRIRLILRAGAAESFRPFDRQQGFAHCAGWTPEATLDEFARLRAENLAAVAAMHFQPADLEKEGRHPEFGRVTLGELIATWAAHDLSHQIQIARVLAKHMGRHAGPWRAYLSVLR